MLGLLENENETTLTPPVHNIQIPGITQSYGAGDVIQRVINAFGITADECSPCQQRKQALNNWLGFTPYTDNKDGLG